MKIDEEDFYLNIKVHTNYGKGFLADFLSQGIPTKLKVFDVEKIRKLMRMKIHDWIKKFYLENPELLDEFLVTKKIHIKEFNIFRKKWDRLNKIHKYTGTR